MKFSFTDLEGKEVGVPLAAGEVVYVVGANGSGKSALMHSLYVANEPQAERITAHRQIWLSSNDTCQRL